MSVFLNKDAIESLNHKVDFFPTSGHQLSSVGKGLWYEGRFYSPSPQRFVIMSFKGFTQPFSVYLFILHTCIELALCQILAISSLTKPINGFPK